MIALTLAAASLAQVPSEAAGEPSGLVTVPALTPVIVRLDEEISSKTSKSGDRFKITVAEDVRVGESVVIPAGSVGEGEVVHAAKRGAGGKAGELIVMARFVRIGDNEIRLRSFALGAAGRDKSVDSLAASLVFGPFGLIQKGGEAYLHAGVHWHRQDRARIQVTCSSGASVSAGAATAICRNESGRRR